MPTSRHRLPLPNALAVQPRPRYSRAVAAQRAPEDTMTEIAQALVSLRQDLKRDISEGVTREMDALRNELREIKTSSGRPAVRRDIHADMGRLADSINQLAVRSESPDTQGLRGEFEELRSLMDGLAREDSLRHMEDRWDGFETSCMRSTPLACRKSWFRSPTASTTSSAISAAWARARPYVRWKTS
jgi:localization factor PodJL